MQGRRETCSLMEVPLLETLRSAELWKGALICMRGSGAFREKRDKDPNPCFLHFEIGIRVY